MAFDGLVYDLVFEASDFVELIDDRVLVWVLRFVRSSCVWMKWRGCMCGVQVRSYLIDGVALASKIVVMIACLPFV